MENGLGVGSIEEFAAQEFATLNLNDKRLNRRAREIFKSMQCRLTSTVRRLCIEPKAARQAYDFF